MSDTIRFDGTTVNAPHALELAQFYAEITCGFAKGTAHWAAVS
ncbi:MAG: VOC family protein, partial [Terrabacter sp.]|nr:VOC family protein [Terrabacter sp.]